MQRLSRGEAADELREQAASSASLGEPGPKAAYPR